ncbi:MAG: choice-of-anchor J domain-containing protein [Sphingobacteriales bacterium]
MLRLFFFLTAPFLVAYSAIAQKQKNPVKCGTDYVMQKIFQKNPSAKKAYLQSEKLLSSQMLQLNRRANEGKRLESIINIPVVFHIVLTNPAVVTDASIQQQLDVLNTDYSGTNADSIKIPGAFKSLYGKSGIRFCLAQRTPDGEPTTGIERIASSVNSIYGAGDPVKHQSKGGADIWDPGSYLNIWVTTLAGGVLGYANIPGSNTLPDNEDGVLISYNTLPGTGVAPYDLGRTTVHEVGHYFRLLHIWGDDFGACSGSDFPDTPLLDDTPNQADATFGCPSGVKIDTCSPVDPGILYEDYMDYTDDACMVMFSSAQVTRMEAAVSVFRASLLTSNGCTPPVLLNRNIKTKKITYPVNNICTSSFQPVILIKNIGTDIITSLKITATIDGSANTSITNWTGSLGSLTELSVTLSNVTGVTTGSHQLTVYTSLPNGLVDEDVSNDTAKTTIVLPAVAQSPLKEGFENITFPPSGWTISNPDNGITWERTTRAAKTGLASVLIPNYDYASNDEKDLLITPLFPVQNVDSTFLTFQIAAATYTDPGTFGNPFDTLEVLITSDCGASYTSIYKKWGTSLITRADKVNGLQTSFVPSAAEWRKDSVYLSPYLTGLNTIQLVFKNTTNFENNIYLDDINLYNIVINPILKAKGLLVTPNPFNSNFVVQHYPNPSALKSIGVYNSLGMLILQRNFAAGAAPNYIDFNLAGQQSGVYYVKLFYTDKTVTQKILKINY